MAGEYALKNEIQTDWNLHDDTWKKGVDKNWKIIDWTSRKWVDSVHPDSSTLPVSPADGDAFIVENVNQVWIWNAQTTQFDKINLVVPIIFRDENLGGWYQWVAGVISPLVGTGVTTVTGYYVDNTDPNNPIITVPKNHIDTVGPTTADDNTQDFSVGSMWFNETNSALWICKDASTGAAVWQAETNNFVTTVAPTVTDDESNGWYVGAAWLNTTTNGFYICTDATAGAAVWSLINGSSISNYAISGSSGGTISPALGTGPVTNFSIAGFITSGGPVEIRVIPDGGANTSMFGNQNTGASDMEFDVIFKRDGTEFARQNFRIAGENPAGTDLASYPGPGAIFALDEDVIGVPGTYTYSIELEAITATTGGRILRSKMYIKEI